MKRMLSKQNWFKVLPVALPVAVFLMLCMMGCSGTEQSPVFSPDIPVARDNAGNSSHQLWGYWMLSVNEDHTVVEATPLRSVESHYNMLTHLEDSTCTNCLWIAGICPGTPGTIEVTIEMRNPFVGMDFYTGFDVRGIAMFKGGHEFPASGLITCDAAIGDAELLNADGYTRLFNPVEYAPGTKPAYVWEYSQGKFANDSGVVSTLNPFRYFSTDYEDRNYFKAGDVIQRMYHIDLPEGPIKFGYAVDASFYPPDSNPPSVPDDFSPESNCTEAFAISTAGPLDGYNIDVCTGSSADYQIFIRDHQGLDTISSVRVECPELFDGYINALADGQSGGAKIYDVTLTNDKGIVEPGKYNVLVEVHDIQTSSILHLIAYQVFEITIDPNYIPEGSPAVEGGNTHYVDEPVQFHANLIDPNGPDDIVQYLWDFEGDGFFEDVGPDPVHVYDTPGIYFVWFRWVDLCGESDTTDYPISIEIIETGVQITLPEDQDYKTAGKTYIYDSDEMEFSAFSIDITDTDGPWDFTVIELPYNYLNHITLDKTDPEVAPVAMWYNPASEYFYKFYGQIYDITGSFYQVEEHNEIQDVLKIWGIYEPDDMGPIAFPSPIVVPFPIDINTDVHDEIGIPGYASFTYDYKVLGEGQVTVPYDGGMTYDALMVRIYIKIETPDGTNGSALLYEWLEDDGKSVALVAAINRPTIPEYHFDETALMYYADGIVSVNALATIDE